MFNFTDDVSVGKRSDAFKLAYIWKYGGLYSDLDYIINYQCLMMKLEGLKGTYYGAEQDWFRKPAISLFYASEPGDPILGQVISKVYERQSLPTLKFLFDYMQRTFPLQAIDLDQCAYHEYDSSWAKSDPNPF
jgi:hypothetical protein